MKAQQILKKDSNFLNSGLLISYLVELLVIAPCPMPFLKGEQLIYKKGKK